MSTAEAIRSALFSTPGDVFEASETEQAHRHWQEPRQHGQHQGSQQHRRHGQKQRGQGQKQR